MLLGRSNQRLKAKKHSDKSRKKMSDSQRGTIKWPNGNPNKGKKLALSAEQIANRSAKRVEWLMNNKTNKVDTNIELAFKKWCNENEIDYLHQYPITHTNGTWLFDFYLPKLNMLVEVDGEYWHSKPQQIVRDKLKESAAKEKKYNFCRISDSNLHFEIILSDIEKIEDHNSKITISRFLKTQ